jgi:acetylglutamate kinase
MKSENFAYWLQGLFELANPQTLSNHQIKLIKNHLNMVKIHEKQLSKFCEWLSDILEFYFLGELTEHQTSLIKKKLAQEFIHVIDPALPDDQQQALTQAHYSDIDDIFPEPGMKC